jgi:hypothetical protein
MAGSATAKGNGVAIKNKSNVAILVLELSNPGIDGFEFYFPFSALTDGGWVHQPFDAFSLVRRQNAGEQLCLASPVSQPHIALQLSLGLWLGCSSCFLRTLRLRQKRAAVTLAKPKENRDAKRGLQQSQLD